MIVIKCENGEITAEIAETRKTGKDGKDAKVFKRILTIATFKVDIFS